MKASVLKPVLATIEQALVRRIMGRLSAIDIETLRGVIASVVGVPNR